MKRLVAALVLACAALPGNSLAQEAEEASSLDFSGRTWELAGSATPGTYRGVEALRLQGALLSWTDAGLSDLVIEYDLALEPGHGFSGVFFRTQEDDGENIYLRHHLSGQPDALQYTPTLGGLSSWQIYTQPGFWQDADFPVGDWMRVRIIVDGEQARMILDGDPVFDMPALIGRTRSGGVAFMASGEAGSWIANISVRPLEESEHLADMAPPPSLGTEGTLIDRWRVSTGFPEDRIAGLTRLPGDLPMPQIPLEAEFNGIVNLARAETRSAETDTVLAEVTLHSDAPHTAILNLGYSDRARVFLNGELLFEGSNVWRSRDYRYLGTISRSYAVPLRLSPGENRLTIAVSEGFGGWGVTGELTADAGVRIEP